MGAKTVFTYIGIAAVPLILLNGALYRSQCQIHDGGACSLVEPAHADDGQLPMVTVTLLLPVSVTVTQSPPVAPPAAPTLAAEFRP
ncbi:MAG: hypothetical protein ACLQJ0_01015 [Steroidobacteraceae bacterium]|jgi:hypothetical protein